MNFEYLELNFIAIYTEPGVPTKFPSCDWLDSVSS